MILNALLAAIATTAGAAIALPGCHHRCRIALDRHRLAAWEPAWAAADPGGPATAEPHTAAPSSGNQGICPSRQTRDAGNPDSPVPDWTTPRTGCSATVDPRRTWGHALLILGALSPELGCSASPSVIGPEIGVGARTRRSGRTSARCRSRCGAFRSGILCGQESQGLVPGREGPRHAGCDGSAIGCIPGRRHQAEREPAEALLRGYPRLRVPMSCTPTLPGRAEGWMTRKMDWSPSGTGCRTCTACRSTPGASLYPRHGFCWSSKMTLAGTPSARSRLCSPAG